MAIVHTHPTSSEDGRFSEMTAKGRSKKTKRPLISDAYSPPRSNYRRSELFSNDMNEMAPTHATLNGGHPSSEVDASKEISQSSSSSRTCNPLPSWLANTFMSLACKHPLRLLLPPSLAQNSFDEPDKLRGPEPIDNQSHIPPGTSEGPFAFNVPEPVKHNESTSQAMEDFPLRQSPQLGAPIEYTNAAYNNFLASNMAFSSQHIPFSTPGPGSLLSSTAETTTVFSIPAPQMYSSSPTLYAADSYVDTDSRLAGPHTPVYYSDPAHFTDIQEQYEDNTDDSEYSDPLPPDLACNPLFSEIYATPGPAYCAPLPIHFDSPTEDPMSSGPLSPGLQIHYDDLDFQWKPFNRKQLVVADIPKRVAFACSLSEHETYNATGQVELSNAIKSYETQRPRSSHFLDPHSSPVPPISPSPSRFLTSPEGYQRPRGSSVVPSPQEQPQNPTTPQKPVFAPGHGIYISPLDESRDVSPSPRFIPSRRGTPTKSTLVFHS
ncbi:hypothetical protein BDZ97DRAFT_1752288 [Flammula alnicola]|nr:hypothetical protein BDZ97DRAFT_1752288 [Flammula alnicola]